MSYEIVKDTDKYLLIRDLDQGISVTNSIEQVVEELYLHEVLDNQYLFYLDSYFELAEVLYDVYKEESEYGSLSARWHHVDVEIIPLNDVKSLEDLEELIMFRELQNAG